MNRQHHALLARELVRACGGPDVIERLGVCRVGRTQLFAYGDPAGDKYMPIDVVADLEAYCGKPIITKTIAELRPYREKAPGVAEATCELTEAAARLQQLARRSASDGALSFNERLTHERELLAIEQLIARTRAANDAGAA